MVNGEGLPIADDRQHRAYAGPNVPCRSDSEVRGGATQQAMCVGVEGAKADLITEWTDRIGQKKVDRYRPMALICYDKGFMSAAVLADASQRAVDGSR